MSSVSQTESTEFTINDSNGKSCSRELFKMEKENETVNHECNEQSRCFELVMDHRDDINKELETNLSLLQWEKKVIERQNQNWEKRCNDLETKFRDIEHEKCQQVHQLLVKTVKIDDLTDKLTKTMKENNQLAKENDQLKQENERKAKLLELRQNTRDNTHKKLEDKLADMTKRNEHIQRENFGQSQQIDMLSMKLGEALSDNNMFKYEKSKLLKQIEQNLKDLDDFKIENLKLQHELKEQTQLLKLATNSQNEKVMTLERELMETKIKKDSLEIENSNQAMELERISSKIMEALNDKDKLSKDYNELSELCKTAMNSQELKCKKLEDDLLEMTNNNETLKCENQKQSLQIIELSNYRRDTSKFHDEQKLDEITKQLNKALICNQQLSLKCEEQLMKFNQKNGKKFEHKILQLQSEKDKLHHENINQQQKIKEISAKLAITQTSFDQPERDTEVLQGKIVELKAEKEKLKSENIEKTQKIERLSRHLSRVICPEKV
jgi:hypothetical protein